MSAAPDYTINWEAQRTGDSWSLGIVVTYPQPWQSNVNGPFDPATVGLVPGQLDGPSHDIAFRIVRPAGTFDLEGVAGDGRGSGKASFSADASYAEEVSRARHEPLTPRDQLALGLFGLPASYIVWLSSEFRHIELSTIMGMHHANVGEDDLMRARSSLGQELSPGALLMSKWSSRPAS